MTGWTKTFSPATVALSALLLLGCESGVRVDATSVSPASQEGLGAVAVENGPKGETVGVGIISWRDMPFQTVRRQAYDYSCGSAAVATLVTYAYGIPTSEKDVFEEMFARGNQDKIRREGFSMLDMSNYLNAHGLQAKGYKMTEDVIEKHRMPFIALVNNKGYNHFVVVKTVDSGRVLVGDPNTGNTEYSRDDFAKIWNGLALVVVNNASKAHAAFGDQKEWRFARAHVSLRNGNDSGIEASELAPLSWQIAPTGSDILSSTKIGTVAVSATGGTP